MFTFNQFVAHLVGDYILQSDWMAQQKTKSHLPAAAHALTYALPFLFLRPSWAALAVIVSTHFVIDRWRLARFVVWAKNWLCPFWVTFQTMGPPGSDAPVRKQKFVWDWRDCQATGYPPDAPPWLAVWLLIIADNTLHIIINGLALAYL